MSDIYYVYYYLRSQDSSTAKAGTPYYVGEGKGNRIKDTSHNVKVPKNPECRIKIAENLTKELAQAIEILHISIWGRKDIGNGILHNRTSGGDGVKGHSDQTREKMRNAKLGRTFTMSESHKEAISQSRMGHEVTEETREKIRKKRALQMISPHSEETKQKLSKMRTGSNNPMFGKKHSPEIIEKIIEAGRNRVVSEETRKKISDKNTGKISSLKGKTRPKEVIEKILATKAEKKRQNPDKIIKRLPLSEETKRKIGDANRDRKLPPISDETREKLRQAALRHYASTKIEITDMDLEE